MKYWVQYYQSRTEHALGSDSILPLDGRLSYQNMIKQALKQAQRLSHIKQFSGFTICKGDSILRPIREVDYCSLKYPINI